MVAHESILFMLVRLIDRLPSLPAASSHGRGRPAVYSDCVFSKALVIMIVKQVQKHRKAGTLPHTAREAHWTRSGWHGWVYGWKVHLAATVAGVWIPLAAELTPANTHDSEIAPRLLARLPATVGSFEDLHNQQQSTQRVTRRRRSCARCFPFDYACSSAWTAHSRTANSDVAHALSAASKVFTHCGGSYKITDHTRSQPERRQARHDQRSVLEVNPAPTYPAGRPEHRWCFEERMSCAMPA